MVKRKRILRDNLTSSFLDVFFNVYYFESIQDHLLKLKFYVYRGTYG